MGGTVKITNHGTITIDCWTAGINHRKTSLMVQDAIRHQIKTISFIWQAMGNDFAVEDESVTHPTIGSTSMVFKVNFEGHDTISSGTTWLTNGESAQELDTAIDALFYDLGTILGRDRIKVKTEFKLTDDSEFDVRAEIERIRRERDKTPKFITMYEKPE